MRVSALIPAYNCEATIGPTLDSVLAQTVAPDEIIVLDDGSTDRTSDILEPYRSRITILRQENGGIASARNALLAKSRGDLVAFLDSDDTWHPTFIQMQRKMYEQHPEAAAFFTGHVNFSGDGGYDWTTKPIADSSTTEVMSPLSFLRRYAAAPGPFVLSFCCVPRRVFNNLDETPFKLRAAEDLYFFNLVLLSGPMVYCSTPLAAYRMRQGSLSSNNRSLRADELCAFELLAEHYRNVTDADLRRAFRDAFDTKRRVLAKVLIGGGEIEEAKEQLRLALSDGASSSSVVKSLALFALLYLPSGMQPAWPKSYREQRRTDSWLWRR
jgi:glycosyltransferase involved in cell wall biosynthesis